MTNKRGYDFENRVGLLLFKLTRKFPSHISVRRQVKLELHNGDEVIPDFELSVNLSYQIDTHLIECQSRIKSTPDIKRKIGEMKSLSSRNRFLFVFEDEEFLSPTHRKSLESDGVNLYSFVQFKEYVGALSAVMTRIHKKDQVTGVM